MDKGRSGYYGYPDMGGALIEILGYAGALVVSLIAWLVWAVLR